MPSFSDRLQLDALAVARGGRVLISDLSLSLVAGEALWLAGPNGVGKTSLLRAIAGLLPLEAGRIAAPPAHFIAIEPAMKPALTLAENLELWRGMLAAAGDPVEAAAALALEDLLFEPLRVFSTGQRRRAALARLLIAERPLWLLDEPLAGLDTASRALVESLIAGHRAAGGLALVASHDPLEGAFERLDLAPRAAL